MSQSVAFAGSASNSVVPGCDCLEHRFGNAADRKDRERCCPSDLTDAGWAVVRDALPLPLLAGGPGPPPGGLLPSHVVDVRTPPGFTDEEVRAALVIRRQYPRTAVLLLSQYVEERYAADLLAANTSGVGYLHSDPLDRLTPREREVLELMAGGRSGFPHDR